MLAIGENFLHYKILSAIGSGGMGEVYLAKDNNLERKVAIKVLRKRFGKNEEGLVRFVREARSASALNHPNIITIYEIGESDGSNYIASEYIDGKTLHSRLKGEHLSVSEVLDISIQVAEAVSAAHAAGIIHRDIKPENVMIRNDGYVKVLDFGLAKLSEREFFSADHDAVTHKLMRTNPGVVMGTVSYMSPEQTRGRDVDTRSDIWSIGVLIYEMVSGALPFAGETTSDVIAAILTSTPRELSQQSPEIPKELDHIVRKALRKNREERYQDIRDLVLDLKLLSGDLVSDSRDRLLSKPFETARFAVTTQDDGHDRTMDFVRGLPLKWYLIPMLVIAGVVLAWFAWRSGQNTNSAGRQQVTSAQIVSWKTEAGKGDPGRARLSPDGKLMAYIASKDGKPAIWLQQLDGGEPFTRKQGDSTDTSPLWSPDGGRIAFSSDRAGRAGIWSSPAFGGEPELLVPLALRSNLVHWSRDASTIYFENGQNLHALNTTTREVTRLTDFDTSQNVDRHISLSADEKRIAFIEWEGEQSDIWVAGLKGEDRVRITNDAAEDEAPIWHPDGKRIVYNSERNGTNQICVVDLKTKEQTQLSLSDTDSYVSDISNDGTKIIYATEKDDADLWALPVDGGKEFHITSDLGVEFWPEVSPDGTAILYQSIKGPSTGGQVLSCQISSKNLKQEGVASLADDGFYARWSPDGNSVGFLRDESGSGRLWVTTSGGAATRPVSGGEVMFGGYSFLPYNRLQGQDYQWSPDSNFLIYVSVRDGVSNIWRAAADGSGETQLSDNTEKNLLFFNPVFSPDGKSIAWSGMTTDALSKRRWSIWHLSDGKVTQIMQATSVTRLIGWASSEKLLVRSVESKLESVALPTNVAIHELNVKTGQSKQFAKLEATYFQSPVLAADAKTIAFVSRLEAGDSIKTIAVLDAAEKTLLEGNDSRVYFSKPVFAPDLKTLYYSKQSNWRIISSINNF